MARYRKLKKVSWAPEGSLCQIQQFSSKDYPSKVGIGVDDDLQFKHSHMSQFGFAYSNLSSGFPRTIMKKSGKLISIPFIKWKSPPTVNMNPNWLVASGEQSEEVGIQKQREMKVFEAVYPHRTDIPNSPSCALCKDGCLLDNRTTPTIRITPIEDEEAPLGSSSVENPIPLPVVSACQPSQFISTTQCVKSVKAPHAGGIQEMISCTEADVGAAASAALTALLKSSEIGSSIDTNILIDIFSNPEAVSVLLNRTSSASTKLSPKSTPEQVLPSVSFSCPSTDVLSCNSASGKWGDFQIPTSCASTVFWPRYVADIMHSDKTVASLPTSIGGPVIIPSPMPSLRKRSQLNITHEVPFQTTFNESKPYFSSTAVTPKLALPTQVKDANYYKNLIKQHGLDNQDFQEKIRHTPKGSLESAYYPDYGLTKKRLDNNSKPCIFHSTPRGCRKGLECPFRHNITSSYQMLAPNMTVVPSAKRMKLGASGLTSMT